VTRARWAAVFATLLLGACTTGPADDGHRQGLAFGACSDSANWDAAQIPSARRTRLEVRCATLAVPVDHSQPGRDSLDMAVVRVRASDQHDRIGSLVLNPGGPGGSGLDSMPWWASWFPDEVLARFDLVTFDPRGTGRSSPIRCEEPPEGQALPSLVTDRGFAAGMALLEARTRACVDSLGERAPFFSTDATARDLDLLRTALGDDALTFVGWSYGARLGAHYAHLFPGRVRALVLDGPPDPQAARNRVVESQIAGFEKAFATYAAQCRSRENCSSATLLDRVVAKAHATPIRSGRPAGDPPATWDVVLQATLGFLAAPESWPYLDAALSEADTGDSGSLYDMIDSLEGKTPTHPDADSDDAATVILCNDTASGPPTEGLRAEAARLASRYPRFGEYGSWWLFGCAYWTVPHQTLPVPESTTKAPLLVVGARNDPSTPYAGAAALARVIGPSAVLLTSSGDGHTSFGRSACVGEHVTRYLVNVAVPPPGTTCQH
jgi:pimeloyl-ACP methyl ester carboxylesterase